MKTPNHSQPSAADLLRLADSIQGCARRLEILATWPDVVRRNCDVQAAGEPRDRTSLLREIQVSRFVGIENDVGFFSICRMAERHAETIFQTDAALHELNAKIRAIEKREGLGEWEEFDPDHPDTPADWKALNAKANRRFEEVQKIEHDRMIGWLRRHGEFDMADLFASDRAAFDSRREAGRCEVYGPMTDSATAAIQEDAGLTQVTTAAE
jgi:hypothetical protein